MKKSFLVYSFAFILLASCGSNNNTNLSEFDENLIGKYNGISGRFEVLDDKIMYNDVVLKPTNYKVESFKENFTEINDNEEIVVVERSVEHTVGYLKNGKAQYRMYLSGKDGNYNLTLEQKVKKDYVYVDSFMPSIDEFSGAYTGYGDSNAYNTVYHIGGDFDTNRGHYTIGYYGAFFGYYVDLYYADSYLNVTENGLSKVISLCDYADNYEYYKLELSTINNVTGLVDLNDKSYISFYYDPMYLTYNYYSNDSSINGSIIDPANKTVIISDVTYSYEQKVDENGQYVILTNGSTTINTRPTQYGMLWNQNGVEKEYVFDSVDGLIGSYEYKDEKFTLNKDYDTSEYNLLINGQKQELKYALYNHQKAIKVKIDGKDAYFTYFKQNTAIMCSVDNEDIFFTNKELFISYYNHIFICKEYDLYEIVVIDEEYSVSYKDSKNEGTVIFNPLKLYPYIEFTVGKTEYTFALLEPNNGVAQLSSDKETFDFFILENVEDIYQDYTSHHQTEVSISKNNISYFGSEVSYELEAYYSEYSYAYVMAINFKVNGTKYQGFTNTGLLAVDEVKESSKGVTKVFIDVKEFAKLVGEYYLEGTFGPEKFKITEDGHFYADTLNSGKNGLDYDVEYDYTLEMSYDAYGYEAYPVIVFESQNTYVKLTKMGHALYVNGVMAYYADYLFNYQGIYVTNAQEVVELRGETLYVDGTKATISEIAHNGSETSIEALVNGESKTYKFNKEDKKNYLTIGDSNEKAYKADIDIDSFVGTYEYNGTTYTLAADNYIGTQIANGYILASGLLNTKEYSIVMYEGHIAMKFTLGLDTVYIYSGSDGNVIEVVSASLPPLPPLPPAPPVL